MRNFSEIRRLWRDFCRIKQIIAGTALFDKFVQLVASLDIGPLKANSRLTSRITR